MTRAEDIPGIERLHIDEARSNGRLDPAFRCCSGCPHSTGAMGSECEVEHKGGTCTAGPEHVWYAEHIFIANKITGIGRRS